MAFGWPFAFAFCAAFGWPFGFDDGVAVAFNGQAAFGCLASGCLARGPAALLQGLAGPSGCSG